MAPNVDEEQKETCRRHGLPWYPSPTHLKVGIAENMKSGLEPINGLRHLPEGDTTGWYIWAGEGLSEDPNFFKPVHVEHLGHWCPKVLRFLGLPPGCRFLIAGEHVDVWEDKQLLDF